MNYKFPIFVLVRCFVSESLNFIFFPLISFCFWYTFSLKACVLNLTIVDSFPSLVGPNRWHLSNFMSTSSSEKFWFLTIAFLAFLVISSIVSCSLGVIPSSITHAFLWYCWRSSTACDNSLFTFFVTISLLSSSATLSSNFSILFSNSSSEGLDVVAASWCVCCWFCLLISFVLRMLVMLAWFAEDIIRNLL